ncbi:MAG TPA: PP2C family protein-serine/threonine phosphatase, partial [Thermobifida alba]|nr:PP2C family protein-serine/threonine phosphatase [Thermobifida alba]
EQQRRVAEAMQRYLLPQLPRVPGVDLEARYHPAPQSSRVGGDWYDAFVLPDGTLTLALGDVMGHDLRSAARMAEVRSMLRAFAWDRESSPDEIVSRLDRALAAIGIPTMATLVLARLDRSAAGSWTLSWTNAGHPPPLLLTPDGGARFLDHASDLLVGTDPLADRQTAVVALEPSSTVVLYTDGLVESAAHSIDAGLAALRRHAGDLARGPLTDLCQGLIERVRPSDNDDDVALLALRVADGRALTAPGEDAGPR